MKDFKTQVVCVFMGITQMYWPIEDDTDPKFWKVFIEYLPINSSLKIYHQRYL